MRLKLGMYRKYMKSTCDRYDVTRLEFEILLYGFDEDLGFSNYTVCKNVPASKSAITIAITKLFKDGYLKKIREYSHGVSRKYIVAVKGRNLLMFFYNKF